MTEFIHTAYGTPTSYLTTELNSLADDAAYLGAEIDNSSNRDMMCRVEIYLASVDLSAQTSPGVRIRIVESLDGTNYEDHDDKCNSIMIPVAETNAAHRKVSGVIGIPPGKFKFAVVNETGAAFASSGNTCKYATFTPETSA